MSTPDGRRLRLSPELAWLVGEIGERSTMGAVADRLAERTGHPVAVADARRLIAGTLVANGIVRLGRGDSIERVPGSRIADGPEVGAPSGTVLVATPAVTATARALRVLGAPGVLAAAAAAGLAMGAPALLSPAARSPGAWLDPADWALAVAAWLVAMLAHEWGHAMALAHAGGTPGPIALTRVDGALALSCGIPGAAALPRARRLAVMLAGSCWQLGAGAWIALAWVATGHEIPAPLAAMLVIAPLLEQAPYRHHDGDLVAATLAGTSEGTGLAWSPLPAAGSSRSAVRGHGLALATLFGAIGVWAVWVPLRTMLAAVPSTGGVLAWSVLVLSGLLAAWCAWVAGSLVVRALRWADADAARRRVPSLVRYFRNGWLQAKSRAPAWWLPVDERKALNLVPVMLSLSFPDRSPAELRRSARRHVASTVITREDHEQIARDGLTDEIRGARAIRSLIAAKQGCIVSSMHLGPFHYVAMALFELGAPITVFAAGDIRAAGIDGWARRGEALGGSFEFLVAGTARAALRAVRALEEGRVLVIYMDGQHGAGDQRDQHRADFPFCGSELFMRTGPAFLAQRAGAPMVPGVCFRDGPVRRVVEFGEPLPPPDGPDDASLVARTAELYRWFEPRVRAHSEQWPGWLYPIMHWRALGGTPTATRAEFDAAIVRASERLVRGRARLVADPTRAGWVEVGREILLVHGPTKRVLQGTPVARTLLAAAQRRARVRDLPRHTGASPEALAPEVARLTLAGLAELRD